MTNTCVCCGDVIPEGIQVCRACEYADMVCPTCGTPLRLAHSSKLYINSQAQYIKLFTCDTCNIDWELTAPMDKTIDEITNSLKRKFWG